MQYVGQTKDFKTRERDWNCIKSRYGSHYLTNERNKYGTENFDVKILAEVESREEAWRTSGGFKWMYKEDYEKMLEKEFES
jgi:hypothetical protein